MRMQREHCPAGEIRRPALDPPDRRVAVFDRKRKRAAHERRPHSLELAFRHPPAEYQPLGAAADAAEQGAHPDLSRSGLGQWLGADFGAAGRYVPERLTIFLRHFAIPCLDFDVWLWIYPTAKADQGEPASVMLDRV